MTTSYSSFCDDFYIEMFVNTQLELPEERDTLLAFFERLQKQFPKMTTFYRRPDGDYCLESSRDEDSYCWVAVEMERLACGVSNPSRIEEVNELQKAVLDLAPHMLGLSSLDIASLDLGFSMEFDYYGNQNEIIADALYTNSPFTCLLDNSQASAINLSSGFVISLDPQCRLQAKLTVESHSSVYEIRTNKFKESEPITLMFTLRQFPVPGEKFNTMEAYGSQFAMIQELMNAKIIPNFVKPLTNTIAQRR